MRSRDVTSPDGGANGEGSVQPSPSEDRFSDFDPLPGEVIGIADQLGWPIELGCDVSVHFDGPNHRLVVRAKAQDVPSPAFSGLRGSPHLPFRVVVDANGAYWRDFNVDANGRLIDGGGYSMCPVSDNNDPLVVAAVYVRCNGG